MSILNIIILFISISQIYSLNCQIKVKCIQECSDYKIKNINNVEQDINTLNSFICEPLDEINFKVQNYEVSDVPQNGGFIASLKITGTDGSEFEFTSYVETDNIFSCSSCVLSSDNHLFFDGETATHKVMGFPDVPSKLPR